MNNLKSGPDRLYHWSKSKREVFSKEISIFKVKTEGKIWTIDNLEKKGATTTSFQKPKSLIVFAGEALDEFSRHPWYRITFFKTLSGQWWSGGIFDYTWSIKDTIIVGEVIMVTKISRIPITNKKRLIINQMLNFLTWSAIPLFISLAVVLCSFITPTNNLSLSLFCFGFIAILIGVVLSKTIFDVKPDPDWKWKQELSQVEEKFSAIKHQRQNTEIGEEQVVCSHDL